MKKLLSIRYTAAAFNFALFILRVGAGSLIMMHGYNKLIHFQESKRTFMNFMGLGSAVSLGMVTFAEFFCGILVIIGLLTRLATIPIMIAMSVVIIVKSNMDFFGKAEHPTLFFIVFFAILILGPGKASVDGVISK
ncbi:MAG: DoxX family protein [Flavitalea sp.]